MNEGHAALLRWNCSAKHAAHRGHRHGHQRIFAPSRSSASSPRTRPCPPATISFRSSWCAASSAGRRCGSCTAAAVLQRHPEHDLPGAEPEPLRQRRGQAARRGLAPACSPTTPSTRSPTACTPRTWRRRLSRHYSTATSPAGAQDNFSLRYALGIPQRKSGSSPGRQADAPGGIVKPRNRRAVATLRRPDARLRRRATAYKRADLLFSDLERLRAIAARSADPDRLCRQGPSPRRGRQGADPAICHATMRRCAGTIRVVYSTNYDMRWPRGSSPASTSGSTRRSRRSKPPAPAA